MKKLLVIFSILLISLQINSINLQGLNNWIINFPENKTGFLDYEITNCIIEDTGVLLDLKKENIKTKLILMRKITYDELIDKFFVIEKNITSNNLLRTEKWYAIINEMVISFGSKNEIITKISFKGFRVRIEEKIILELVNKIEKEGIFVYDPVKKEITYLLKLKNIPLSTGNNDIFLGWNNFFTELINWFQKKIKERNKEVLGLITETKIYSLGEIAKEIKKIRSEEEPKEKQVEEKVKKEKDERKEKEGEIKEIKKEEVEEEKRQQAQGASLSYKRSLAVGITGTVLFPTSWIIQNFLTFPYFQYLEYWGGYPVLNLIPFAGPFINVCFCSIVATYNSTFYAYLVISIINGILEISSFVMMITGFVVANKYKNYKSANNMKKIVPLVRINFHGKDNIVGEIGLKFFN